MIHHASSALMHATQEYDAAWHAATHAMCEYFFYRDELGKTWFNADKTEPFWAKSEIFSRLTQVAEEALQRLETLEAVAAVE